MQLLIMMIAGGLTLASCGDDDDEVKKKGPDITLNKHELTLEIDETERLEATFNPFDTPNTAHTWSSNNPDIASVDETGLVTAIAKGEATIMVRALDGGKTDKCKVTVTAPIIFTFSEWHGFSDSKPATINIAMTAKKSWKAETGDSWLTVSPTSGSGDATLKLSAKDNASTTARTTTLTLTASTGETEQLTITQPGRTLEVGVANVSFNCNTKEEQQAEVKTDGVFAVSTDEDWIATRVSSNIIYISVSENLALDKRDGTVTVFLSDLTDGTTLSRKIKVEQNGLYESKGEGDVDRDGYGEDADNNTPSSDVDVSQNGYGDDENHNQPNGNETDVDKEGYDDEKDLNQPGNTDADVETKDYDKEDDLNKPGKTDGDVKREDYDKDENLNPKEE